MARKGGNPGRERKKGENHGHYHCLTDMIIALMMLAFNMLLAWATKTVLPAVRAWLAARTTAQQRQTLWNVTLELVSAAQQLYDEGLLKVPSLSHVVEGLQTRGFDVDMDTIKAAVKEINKDVLAFVEDSILVEENILVDEENPE